MTHSKSFIRKAVAVFASNTLLSRITGLFRDIVLSSYFSARETDIWITAFRVPNLLRRLVAENAITVAVVPVLSDYLKHRDRKSFQKLINSFFTVFILFMLVIVILGVVFAPYIIKLMAPSFTKDAFKYYETVRLARIMFPYIALIAFTAFFMGILNTLDHFFATAFHPVLFNLTFAIGIILVKGGKTGLIWAGIFVILGGVFQVLLEVFFLRKKRVSLSFTKFIDFSGVKKILKLFVPALVSSSIVPLAVLVNTAFASLTGNGGVSYLYWADRIVQLPLGIFAVSISTAVLPLFSRNKQNSDGIIASYKYAFKLSSIVLIPSCIFIYIMATPVVELIFLRGHFSLADAQSTGLVLAVLSLSLFPSGIVRITSSLYYAFSRPKVPLVASFFSILANLILAYLLVPKMGLLGLSIAIVVASLVSAIFLFLYFRIKILPIQAGSINFFIRITALNVVFFFVVKFLRNYFAVSKLNTVIISIASLFVFLLLAYIFRLRKDL